MKNINSFLLLILLLGLGAFLTGCASDKLHHYDHLLTPEGRMVKISRRLPPINCREIGEVYASLHSPTFQLEWLTRSVRNKMRNKSAALGANYVMIETFSEVPNGSRTYIAASGTSYNCYVPKKRETLVLPEDRLDS